MTATTTARDDLKVAMIRTAHIRAHDTNVRRELGDLRELRDSVQQLGIMQPITVEKHPRHWLLRDGHRRHAVATMLGHVRIPAVIHTDELDADEWLVQAVHHNHRRRNLDKADKIHAVTKMREAGMSWEGIAREFGVSASAVRRWVAPQSAQERTRRSVGLATLGGWATAWREAVEEGDVTALEALEALERLAVNGRVSDHYPPAPHRLAS